MSILHEELAAGVERLVEEGALHVGPQCVHNIDENAMVGLEQCRSPRGGSASAQRHLERDFRDTHRDLTWRRQLHTRLHQVYWLHSLWQWLFKGTTIM